MAWKKGKNIHAEGLRQVVLCLFIVLKAAGHGEEPRIRIHSPTHGAVFKEHHVSVHAVVSGYDMSLESGCAIVYLNTVRRYKTCTSEIMVELSDVREGLSVVDVVLVDDGDSELTVMATSSFTVGHNWSSVSPSTPHLTDARSTASSLIDAIYSMSTYRKPSFDVEVHRAPTARPLHLLLSFATDHMRDAQSRLRSTAIAPGGFDGTLFFGPEHVDRAFVSSHAAVFAQRKGAGLWLWKPWLINQTLHHRPQGELIMYLDAGLAFVAAAAPLLHLAAAAEEEVVCFGMALHSERKFTKRLVLEALGCDNECAESAQRAATFILFRVGPRSRAFVSEWLQLASNGSLISETESVEHPEHEDFLAHRHDQSLFSVLTKKRGFKAHRVPTQYGLAEEEQATFPDTYPQILLAK